MYQACFRSSINFRIKFLGQKGILKEFFAEFKNVPNESKKEFGQTMNELKTAAQDKVNQLKDELESKLEEKGVYGDLTRPGEPIEIGSRHPISIVKNQIIEIFSNIGFNVSEGPEVPVLGKIAAGTPVEAIQNEVSRVPLPSNLEKNGSYFGLKVQGDSMIEAGINEGDTVIIKKTETAENGKIVVALIDDHEAMLKRIRKKGKTVALESANRNYETKIFGPDRVKVQGILVSLYRNFS